MNNNLIAAIVIATIGFFFSFYSNKYKTVKSIILILLFIYFITNFFLTWYYPNLLFGIISISLIIKDYKKIVHKSDNEF